MKRFLNWLFNKKQEPEHISLRRPDDSLAFFQDLKAKSELYWQEVSLNPKIYGFQVQQGTRWNDGLTEQLLSEFQREVGIDFPEGLRNYYRVMNGVDLPAVNVYGSSGEGMAYSQCFYSYPRDLAKIKEMIAWIYDANNVSKGDFTEKGISKIFPIYAHRYVLTDTPDCSILSMYGDDIVFWADNISKLLAQEIFDWLENSHEFENNPYNRPAIKFWLDNEE